MEKPKNKKKRNRRNKKKRNGATEDSNSIQEHSLVNLKNNPKPDFTPLKDVIPDSFFNE
jgi:hypothetical protein